MIVNLRIRVWWYLFPLWVLTNGCVGSLFLGKGRHLLTDVEVKGYKFAEKEELADKLKQQPNTKIAGLTPLLYFHLVGKGFYDADKIKTQRDSTVAKYDRRLALMSPASDEFQKLSLEKEKKLEKIDRKLRDGNWFMRTFGEPPSVYDTALTEASIAEIKAFYFNKGYFDAEVAYKEKLSRLGNVHLKINVKEGEAQHYRKVKIEAEDSLLQAILDSHQRESLLKPNARFDKETQENERERIDKLFRSKGFLQFSRAYVLIENDTANSREKLIDVTIHINNPPVGKHRRFTISETEIRLMESEGITELNDTLHYPLEGIVFYAQSRYYDPSVLKNKTLGKKGEFTNQSYFTKTQVLYSSLDLFRQVSLTLDTLPGNKVKQTIIATKMPIYDLSLEGGVTVSLGAPGPYINTGFKYRNPIRTMGIFDVNARYSEEGQVSFFLPDSIYRSTELGINASFTYPEFLSPFASRLVGNSAIARTRFQLGISSIRRPEYTRVTSRFSMLYTFQPSPVVSYGISPIDIAYNETAEIRDLFLDQLVRWFEQGNPLLLSFRNSIVTGLNGYYNFNNVIANNYRNGYYFRAAGEFGGALPSLYGIAVFNDRDNFYGLQVFRYYRTSFDGRKYQPLGKNSVWANRAMVGIVSAWQTSRGNILPYEKYFFAGGSNSIRAWAPRRLGPGSYFPGLNADGSRDYVFEQPGELQIEFNSEIRQKLFGFFEGALFVDAGNVWMLRDDPSRQGAGFRSDKFFTEIAIGSGFGLRLNFNFLIIRFDVGIKVYDPTEPSGEKWQLKYITPTSPLGRRDQAVLNLGVGYPF